MTAPRESVIAGSVCIIPSTAPIGPPFSPQAGSGFVIIPGNAHSEHMDPNTALELRGGIARTRTLRDQGVSAWSIRRALERGDVLRPRQGWLSSPDADPALVAAAESGTVISCVSQATRLGLWTFDDGWHVALAPHAKLSRPVRGRVHWHKPLIPRDPDSLVDPVENVLAVVADCQPYENALAIWESAIRNDLADMEALAGYPLRPAARRLLDEAAPHADSGLETVVVPRLRWLGLPLRRQIVIAGHRVDLLIDDRLVVQIDGGHHVDEQRMRDNEHDARLRLMGYHVIRVGYRQVLRDWASVQDLIARAVAQGLHRAR